ncbi:hypothetical protein [Paraburkholderia sp.]|uniref:hypothetical protein n=1 Tax=Paraburkholderia sp. TaxID=1926495 RepID=UPI0023851C2A|nr:hypothetical protein [Paraburkholderia sp.]MDE1183523.1 hypothetical protein [Paraburkholderia sp.]
MHIHDIRHFIARLMGSRDAVSADTSSVTKSARSTLEFDPNWHGDHWQNLLSSPMDARHYVMEDWTFATPLDFEPTGVAHAR